MWFLYYKTIITVCLSVYFNLTQTQYEMIGGYFDGIPNDVMVTAKAQQSSF